MHLTDWTTVAVMIALTVGAASASIEVQVTKTTDDPFLNSEGLVSLTISVAGFSDGDVTFGVAGNSMILWTVMTTDPSGFFNYDEVIVDAEVGFWDPNSVKVPGELEVLASDPVAASFDSGLMGLPEWGEPLAPPMDAVGAFAMANDGGNDLSGAMSWMSPDGTVVDAAATIDVLRVTFCRSYEANGSFAFAGPGDNLITWSYSPEERCSGDITGTGEVGVPDLLALLASWGTCESRCPCAADLTGSGEIGVQDLLQLLANWGPCGD